MFQALEAVPLAFLIAAICVGIAAQAAAADHATAWPRARAAAAALDTIGRAMRLAELDGCSEAAAGRVHDAVDAAAASGMPLAPRSAAGRRFAVYACWQFTRTAWRVSRLRPRAAATLLFTAVGVTWVPLIIGAHSRYSCVIRYHRLWCCDITRHDATWCVEL